MAGQTVTDTVKVEVKYTMDGNNAENVMHVLCDGVPTAPMIEDIRGVFQAWLLSDWMPLASTQWACTGITLTDLTSLSGIRRVFQFATPIEGEVSSQALPANATLAVKADTGTRGRGKSGRVFWVGLAEEQVSGNTVSTATTDAIAAALNNLKDLIIAVTPLVGLAIPHYVVGGIRPPVCTASVVQGFALADNIVDSQRDRLPGHKRHKRRTP